MKTFQFIKSHTIAVLVSTVILCAGSTPALAAYYSDSWFGGFANGGIVPDGNVTGWSDTRTTAGIAALQITDVNVWLELSGGWNGDLYAYLSHSSGFSVLLNRVGVTANDAFGYSDAGMNVILDDSTSNGDIHRYAQVNGFDAMILDGSKWQPDGRNVDPLAVLDTDQRSSLLDVFNGLDPNGEWTLFIADLSGGEPTTVTAWGLAIEAVNPPIGVPDGSAALGLLGLSLGALMWLRRPLRNQS